MHGRLASGFSARLSAQVDRPMAQVGERAGRQMGERVSHGLSTAAKVGAVALGGALALGGRAAARGLSTAVDRASDLNETVSKSEHIFGRQQNAIDRFARGSVASLGLTRAETLGAASAFGDMFRQLGIGLPETTRMSKSMVTLAADFASFHNADITDVLQAQQAAFRGEFDSLQKFVPGINAARVQQEALRLTHKKSAKDLTDAEKAQAAYNIMLRDGARARGDFARTADQQANQERIAAARIKEISTTIGGFFLPGVLNLTRAFNSDLLPQLQALAEQHGPAVQRVVTDLSKDLADLVKGADFSKLAEQGVARLQELGPKVADGLQRLADKVGLVREQVRPADTEVSRLSTALNLSGAALDFAGRHMDLLVKALPALVAGYVAYKGVQALANAAAVAEVALMPARIASTFVLARAIRSLGTAQAQAGGATAINTAVQQAATGATNVGTVALLRQRAAAVGHAIASRAAAAASLVWRGAQLALNFVLSANPIGLVVLAIAALVTGIVIAYQRSETFRKIVDGAFRAVGTAAVFLKDLAVSAFQFLLRTWLTVAGGIVKAAATAFGWIPGIGPKVREAAAKFETFKDKVNESLNRLKSKKISVTATFGFKTPPGVSMHDIVGARGGYVTPEGILRRAAGGIIDRGSGPTADDVLARLSRGEFVVNAKATAANRDLLEAINRSGLPGFAAGGGVNLEARPPDPAAFGRALGRFEEGIDRGMQRLAGRFDRLFEGGGAVGGRFPGTAVMQYIAGFIRAAGIPFSIISGLRPGAVTRGTGRTSLHALGRALDLVGPNMLAIWAAATRIPFRKEVIFSPAPYQVYSSGIHRGPPSNPATRADHYNHVHVGLFHRGAWRLHGDGVGLYRRGEMTLTEPFADAVRRVLEGRTRGGQQIGPIYVQPKQAAPMTERDLGRALRRVVGVYA